MKLLTLRKIAACIPLLAIGISQTLSAGPNRWTNVDPEGGSVFRIAADPLNPSTLYAGTCAGIFKSVDAGASWNTANTGLPATPPNTIDGCFGVIEVDPQNSGTVYTFSQQQLFKTTDGGAHWSAIAGQYVAGVCCQALAIDPLNPATLYAGGGKGGYKVIFKSMDGGTTWTQLNTLFAISGLTPESPFLIADPQNSGMVYASPGGVGDLSGLYKTTDGGASWNLLHSGVAFALSLDPQNSSILYLSSESGVSKSTDEGASWKDLSLKMPPGCQCNWFRSITVNPQNSALVTAILFQNGEDTGPESFFLFISSDGGATWSQSGDSTLAANDLHSLTPDPQDPRAWYVGTNNGILKTINGGASWNFANSGLRATPIGQVFIDPTSGTLIAVRGNTDLPSAGVFAEQRFNGFFQSLDGGKSWDSSGSATPVNHFDVVARPNDPRTLYTEVWNGLFYSGDGGESWSQIWTKPRTDSEVLLTDVAIDPQNPNNMFMGAAFCPVDCILRSGDGGRTWMESMASFPGPAVSPGAEAPILSILAVDPRDPSVLYAGTSLIDGVGCGPNDGYGYPDAPALWKSVDGGMNWVYLTNSRVPAVTAILIDPQKPSTVYYSDCSVHKSTDGGKTWTAVLQGSYDILVMDPQNSSALYAAASASTNGKGILRSTDGGLSWTTLLSPNPRASEGVTGGLNSLAVDPRDSRTVYAATSDGLFAFTLDPHKR